MSQAAYADPIPQSGPAAERSAAAPAIETLGLRKQDGRKIALHDLSLRVEAGEVFGFLGPNGAGKTTTVKILLGLVRPSAGQAWIFGQPAGAILAFRARDL